MQSGKEYLCLLGDMVEKNLIPLIDMKLNSATL